VLIVLMAMVAWGASGAEQPVLKARTGDPGVVPALDRHGLGLIDVLTVRTGDRSAVLHWSTTCRGPYTVRRSIGTGGAMEPVATVATPHFADLAVTNGGVYRYMLEGQGAGGARCISPTMLASPRAFASDDEFLELLEATAFDYFWHEADPKSGLVRDRSTTNSFASIAAVGFGLTGLGIGVDRGWIGREEARDRARATLETFWAGAQGTNASGCIGHRGWFYHFLDWKTATRFRQTELSSIDTALFLAGVLYVRQYFDRDDPAEAVLRALAGRLIGRVDWRWMTQGGETLTMGWHPETGFIAARWVGYNEAMILYLMALGVPEGALPASAWEGWVRGYRWQTEFGYSFLGFAPLFGHQYSHCWVDFQGRPDAYTGARGLDYAENTRRATLAQRRYCIANPGRFAGYGPEQWGLTACDGPSGYAARGAPPAEHDDGTLAPTAVAGSLPFAPKECLAALRSLYDRHRERLWTPYGFRDAFNLGVGWWDPDILGIDQGPILVMIENYRTGRVWERMRGDPILARGLKRAGFGAREEEAGIRP
jgi:hypothetical protein